MRKLTALVFLIFTGTIYSQVAYTSHFTQSFPTIFTTEMQEIKRTIIFEPQTITISTNIEGGKEIDVLNIEGHDNLNGTFTFFCKNRHDQEITVAIPEQKQVEVIDYYYRSPKTKEETQLRFHVEKQ